MSTHVTIPFPLPRSGFRGTEFYRLIPSPYKAHEALLQDYGGLRGKHLALAVGGVEPASKKPGIRLSPARCIKWLALFSAGFEAVGTERGWRFRISGGSLVILAEAVRTAEAVNAQ